MAKSATSRCWNGRATTVAIITVILVAGGLIIGGFRYQGTALGSFKAEAVAEHTAIRKDVSDLRVETAVVKIVAENFEKSLISLHTKVDRLLPQQCPATVIHSPVSER